MVTIFTEIPYYLVKDRDAGDISQVIVSASYLFFKEVGFWSISSQINTRMKTSHKRLIKMLLAEVNQRPIQGRRWRSWLEPVSQKRPR
jgi:hypothetical protein